LNVKRRKLLKTFVACAVTRVDSVLASNELPLTGKDVEGPFYPTVPLPVTPTLFLGADALGDPLTFSGRITDRFGAELQGIRIDIWQCDANQTYNHPADRGNRDPDFRGFASQLTGRAGEFTFQTIVPVSYGGRPPHIHIKLWRDKTELLTTQVYLQGYRGNVKRKIKPARVAGAELAYDARFDFVV
jgi:protocatechuate 3,4-dioxygenase beta subunit